MKHTIQITESQRMALCTLLSEYARRAQYWRAPDNFIDCSQDPAVHTTALELLAIFLKPADPKSIRSAEGR